MPVRCKVTPSVRLSTRRDFFPVPPFLERGFSPTIVLPCRIPVTLVLSPPPIVRVVLGILGERTSSHRASTQI